MEWARLNIFQTLVRQWESLHPYNGAQVLRLTGQKGGIPNAVTLQSTWYETLAALGLGETQVNRKSFRFTPISPNNHHPTLAATDLQSHLTAELNRIYTEDECPLRPFIIPAPSSGAHNGHLNGAATNGESVGGARGGAGGGAGGGAWIGIAYRHWVADSVAIRRVLREWYARLYEPSLITTQPLERDAGGYWRLFGPGDLNSGLGWTLPRALLTSAAQAGRMKRVQRVETKTVDYSSSLILADLPDDSPGRLHAWARRRGFKVNDVLLAALSVAIANEPLLTRTPRRQDMAMGSIVDLRQFTRQDLGDVFSLYLGFTTVFLRPRHYRDFSSAVARIASAHAEARSTHAAPASLLRMAAGIVSHRYLPTREKSSEFYRKRVPLSGGISNVLLREPWLNDDRVADYIRASPTGPMMPVVLAATTLGSRLNLALTHRTALLDPPTAQRILTAVSEQLSRL